MTDFQTIDRTKQNTDSRRRYYVKTFGCQMNEHDSEKLGATLRADGLLPTEDIDEADVVVFNTCCIRENADNKLYGHLGNLRERSMRDPNFRLVVAGCLAQRDKQDLLKRAPYVDVVLGTNNTSRVADLLKQAEDSGNAVVEVLDFSDRENENPFFDKELMPSFPTPDAFSGEQSLPAAAVGKHAAYLTIQSGCDNSCAFCIVPSVRGPEVSVPFQKLIGQVEALVRNGISEVTLLGQNVNSYGRDITVALRRIAGNSDLPDRLEQDYRQATNSLAVSSNKAESFVDYETYLAGQRWAETSRRPAPLFADLLRAVGEVDGIKRIRFTSPHPKDLRPETIEAMAETVAVCEQLHLPLQSGSDAVLKAMRRGYTAEMYLERLQRARNTIEDLAVTTDLIVGFPGETEQDFLETLSLAAEVCFDSAYVFIFSPRKGTRAAEMAKDFIDEDTIADRFSRLNSVIERSALNKNLSRVGKTEEILVEGISKKDPTYFTGRTRQGKLVHFRAQNTAGEGASSATYGDFLAGSYLDVKITAAAPHHLFGEPL
jgi:tRNA-2-methylthio-N6-dimethylallyladenosine synthase